MSAWYWIERLGKDGQVLARERIDDEAITIGRGYDNRIVVDDPYVAARQLRITRDATGALQVEDLDSENGSFDAARNERFSRLAVIDEAAIAIGETLFRLRTPAYAVAPARNIDERKSLAALSSAGAPAPVAEPAATRRIARRALLLMAAVIAWGGLSIWLSQTGEAKVAAYLPAMVMMPVLMLTWSGAWSLVNRIFAGHGNFFRHAFIALAVLLVSAALDAAGMFIDYALAWGGVQKWLAPVNWLLMGVLVFLHLRLIAPRQTRLAGALVSMLVVTAISVHLSLRAESERLMPQRIAVRLLPPWLQMKSPTAPEDFFKAAQALKPDLDEERKKEPPAGGGMYMGDFD